VKIKKYLVLSILFILPLTMYMFFASGKDNFGRLPVLTQGVFDISEFTTMEGESVTLYGNITVLGFYGRDPHSFQANAFNLTHKIYKKNREFQDFQFVFLMPNGSEASALKLKNELSEIVNTEQWKFAFGPPTAIVRVYNSLKSSYPLSEDLSTPFVFIIDKDGNLRGRDDDEDVGNGADEVGPHFLPKHAHHDCATSSLGAG